MNNLKQLYIVIAILVIAITIAFLPNIQIDKDIFQTLYTVIGIMFSVVMSLIISFTTDEIKNQEKKESIRNKVEDYGKYCIKWFFIVTTLFIIYSIDGLKEFCIFDCPFSFSKTNFTATILSIGIIYYVKMFRKIKKEKNRLEDKINME